MFGLYGPVVSRPAGTGNWLVHPDVVGKVAGEYIFLRRDMWYVYYLYNAEINRFYLGKTNNLERRLNEHNRGSEIYSKRAKHWILIGFIECKSNTEAMSIERTLKKSKNKNYTKMFFEKYGTLVK